MRGNIKQRSKGSWRLRYDGPLLPGGGRKQITETVRGTRTQAEAVLRERLTGLEHGNFVPKTSETFGAFMGRWLNEYAFTNCSPRTVQGYRGNFVRYIQPAIGGIPLQALMPGHVQGLYGDMQKRGLSAGTVLAVHRIIHESLGHALKWGLVSRNVSEATTPPRLKNGPVRAWDSRAVDRFLQAADGSEHRDYFHAALLLGLRRSELVGLKWDVVDLDAAQLRVVRTLQRLTKQGLVEGLPKTTSSRRTVALGSAVGLLRRVRLRQMEARLRAGPLWVDTGYVFTGPLGLPLEPDNLTHAFQDIVRAAGLPPLTLHGARHTMATLMLAAGVNPKVVSERLGHAGVAITLAIYQAVLPGMQEAAAIKLDEILAAGRA